METEMLHAASIYVIKLVIGSVKGGFNYTISIPGPSKVQ